MPIPRLGTVLYLDQLHRWSSLFFVETFSIFHEDYIASFHGRHCPL